MKRISIGVTVAILLSLSAAAQGLIAIQTVTVGDAGNRGEISGQSAGIGSSDAGPDRICGSVNYTYRIGKYEVTTAQYVDFLNHKAKSDPYGLYNTYMYAANADGTNYGCKIQRSGSSGSYTYAIAANLANKPVNYVSYWDSLRFINWLNNGQGDGDTDTGAYTLNSYNGNDGRTIVRNIGFRWYLPSEDEWYKAAYYKGGGTDAAYWDYPTQSDTAPTATLPTSAANSANYNWALGAATDVGAYTGSASAYGTFDQGGNVWEWNEALVFAGSATRGLRGGSFGSNNVALHASVRYHPFFADPSREYWLTGFRVAEAAPEPSSIVVLAGGLVTLLGIRRRKT